MSKVDEELTRRFRRAERPVETEGLFEGLARRRRRRRTIQRLQAGALAVAVLVGTGAGFVALRAAFEDGARDIGSAAILPEDGTIVFSAESSDRHVHIHAIRPDGSGRQLITDFGTDDTDPAVSPDGRTIAFVHRLEDVPPAIATIPIQGGPPTWLTDESFSLTSGPSWSPDGSRLVVSGDIDRRPGLYIVGSSERPRPLATDPESEFADPHWSPTGERIAYSVRDAGETAGTGFPWTIQTIRPDGVAFTLERPAGKFDEHAPTWSPDGTRIAFIRTGGDGDEIWTMAADGSDETLIAIAVEARLERDLAWAPDGSSLLVSNGEWIYGVAATPEGDPRANFVQVVRGFTPTWSPVPLDTESSVATGPEPGASPSSTPDARDVGLGFNLCHAEMLGRIDFTGSGANGRAWVGVPTTDDGSCPRRAGSDAYVAAADADGDGRAEAWSDLPWECSLDCVPYAAVDLDGNGTEELIVASSFSITDYYVLRYLGPPQEPSPVIAPVLIAEPGHEPAGLIAGEPVRIDAGGDAGYSSTIVCEPPVIAWTWTFAPIDSREPTEVHHVEIELRDDGAFHVVRTNDFTVPAGQPTAATDRTAPSCGVDWHPSP